MNEPLPFRKTVAPDPPTMSSLVRAVIAQAHATLDRSVRAADYATTTWPNDASVPLVLRASVAPTLMANATALSPIVQHFVEALGPLSASGALANEGISLSSFGRGLVSVPSFAPGEASFVAEGAPIPAKQFVSTGPTLSPYKLATIVTLSAELLEHSDAETLVRTALIESVALGLDRVLFSASAAVAGQQPAGLLNGIAGLTPTVAGGAKSDVMADDLAKLMNAIAPVAGAGFFVVAAPEQATALQFRLARQVENVRASEALAAGTVIMIAPRAFVSIFETPRVDASIEALVHQEDTTPLPIASGATIAAPTRSLFQTNVVGLRMITPVSWALRSSSAVAWMSAVNW
jgi:Phage capsid family